MTSMYEVIVLNLKTNKEFKRAFSSPYLLNQYLKKIRYSKHLKLLSYICY